jgi:hypothetical protein
MNKQLIRKCSLGICSALAVVVIWAPRGQAQILKPSPTTNPSTAYTCAVGGLHDVTDLKGGDLPEHQTGGSPKYTCLSASKPSGTEGHYSCPNRPGDLHLVSDLTGGVSPEHQVGSPARTCIQGHLPGCAPFTVPSKSPNGGVLTPGDVCMPPPSP